MITLLIKGSAKEAEEAAKRANVKLYNIKERVFLKRTECLAEADELDRVAVIKWYTEVCTSKALSLSDGYPVGTLLFHS
jgi:hypothetical protein